jgi:polyhydroxyalkanoate synthesis regulator phasin
MRNGNGKVKKYIYSGIGLASHSKEIVRDVMNDFMKQNKVSEADGQKIVANAMKNMQSHLPDVESKYNQAVMKVIQLANAEIQMLQKTMAKLEQRAKPAAGKIAKKIVAKKSSAGKKVATKLTHKSSR